MASKQPVFKPYFQDQIMAFPPTLGELVPKDHPVRVVDEVINKVNIQPLMDAYPGNGTSSYHPQMLLKVVVFGYVSNIYSSRKLEAACRENVNFMWLSAMNYPDHNTINRFRGVRLKANANKYTFVWKKAIRTNKEKMKKALAEIWDYAQQVATREDSLPDPPDFTELDSEKVQQTIDQLNRTLSSKPGWMKR